MARPCRRPARRMAGYEPRGRSAADAGSCAAPAAWDDESVDVMAGVGGERVRPRGGPGVRAAQAGDRSSRGSAGASIAHRRTVGGDSPARGDRVACDAVTDGHPRETDAHPADFMPARYVLPWVL